MFALDKKTSILVPNLGYQLTFPLCKQNAGKLVRSERMELVVRSMWVTLVVVFNNNKNY